jgi:hypothetical protein
VQVRRGLAATNQLLIYLKTRKLEKGDFLSIGFYQSLTRVPNQGDHMRYEKNRPKCGQTRLFAKINSLIFPWKKVAQIFGRLL